MWMKVNNRHYGPFRDNSKNVPIRMSDEDYALLQFYLSQTPLKQSTFFRKLITGEKLFGRNSRHLSSLHAAYNMIYSNVMQIVRKAPEYGISKEKVRGLEILVQKLGDEVYELGRMN